MLTIRIEGLDRLKQRLGVSLTPHLQALTRGLAEQAQSEITPYPPETEANRPHTVWTRGRRYGRTQWYVRGEGPHWLVKGDWPSGRAKGTVYQVRNVMGIERFKHTSEQLGQQWFIEPYGQTGHVLVNRASYARFVHSAERQARFHGRRGWKTDRQVIESMRQSGILERMARDFVAQWMGEANV